jgi:O-methyltransferase involved in polyketide biosynthesis
MGEIGGVSDTARWVAVYRALESARPDALFDDPLARILVGDKADVLASPSLLPRGARDFWPTVVRTRLVDELVDDSLARGCDRVINLAAGLDTRPYRLDLPAELRWYEADVPAIVAEKDAVLDAYPPRCAVVRRAVDVTDVDACAEFLAEATAGADRALVITEGLLPYLHSDQVRAIDRMLRRAEVRWWIIDHWSPAMLVAVNLLLGAQLTEARWHFAAPLRFFHGWSIDEAHSTFRAAARLRRSPLPLRWSALLPDRGLIGPRRSLLWCGAVRLAAGAQVRGGQHHDAAAHLPP